MRSKLATEPSKKCYGDDRGSLAFRVEQGHWTDTVLLNLAIPVVSAFTFLVSSFLVLKLHYDTSFREVFFNIKKEIRLSHSR
jgi:hypothetical protein